MLNVNTPLTTGLELQSPPLVLQSNSTGHQLQFKELTQEEQLKRRRIGRVHTERKYSCVGSTVHEVYMHTLTCLSLNSRRKSLHPQLAQNQCCEELTSK